MFNYTFTASATSIGKGGTPIYGTTGNILSFEANPYFHRGQVYRFSSLITYSTALTHSSQYL